MLPGKHPHPLGADRTTLEAFGVRDETRDRPVAAYPPRACTPEWTALPWRPTMCDMVGKQPERQP